MTRRERWQLYLGVVLAGGVLIVSAVVRTLIGQRPTQRREVVTLESSRERISPAKFRGDLTELLRQREATDEGQAVVAAVAWGRRQLEVERGGRAHQVSGQR